MKRFVRVVVLVMMLLVACEASAQVRPNTNDIYGLFAEEKVFHAQFNWPIYSSVSIKALVNQKGEYAIKFKAGGKICQLHNYKWDVSGNTLYLWFRDMEGYWAKVIITLQSDGSMKMYIPPIKTEADAVFKYIGYMSGQSAATEDGYMWVEPTVDGLAIHPTRTKADASNKYWTTERLSKSFNKYISEGYYILQESWREYQRQMEEERRRKEEELRRQEEERRRQEEERRRKEIERQNGIRKDLLKDRSENSVMVTVKSNEMGSVLIRIKQIPNYTEKQRQDAAYVRIADSVYGNFDESAYDIWQDSLRTGTYSIIASGDWYETMSQKISVTKDDTVFVVKKMTSKTQDFTFKADDSQQSVTDTGLQVYVNDKFVGNTPATAKIKIGEPNKIEYKHSAFIGKTFYLSVDGNNVSVGKSPTSKSDNISAVTNLSNNTMTVKLSKGRKGAINKSGNGYLCASVGTTSYPSLTYGIYYGITSKHFCADFTWYRAHVDSLSGMQMGVRLGVAFPIKYFRLTPFAGLDLDFLKNKKTVDEDKKNVLLASVPMGLKFEFATFKWVIVGVSPEVSWYLREKRWVYGLRFNISLLNLPFKEKKQCNKEAPKRKYNTYHNPYMDRRYSPVPMRRR